MRKVVSNTTPLIGLAIVKQFEVLHVLFGQLNIPNAVYREASVAGKTKPGAEEVKRGSTEGWIQIVDTNPVGIVNSLQTDLDPGESEAIAWAFENKADLLLIDEYKGRARATGMDIRITGTIGVLLLAREAGL